jgi:hypothetical protein
MQRYEDEPKKTTLTELKIVNKDTRNLVLPNGHMVGPGESTVLVYADEVSSVMDMVEPSPEVVAAAEVLYQKRKIEYLKKEGVYAEYLKNPSDPQVKSALESMPHSPESSYRVLAVDRDRLPLLSCEILREGILPPTKDNDIAAAIIKGLNRTSNVDAQTISEIVAQTVRALQPQQQQGQSARR